MLEIKDEAPDKLLNVLKAIGRSDGRDRGERSTGVSPVGPMGFQPVVETNGRQDACPPHSQDGCVTRVGLLVNFGRTKVEYKRLVF